MIRAVTPEPPSQLRLRRLCSLRHRRWRILTIHSQSGNRFCLQESCLGRLDCRGSVERSLEKSLETLPRRAHKTRHHSVSRALGSVPLSCKSKLKDWGPQTADLQRPMRLFVQIPPCPHFVHWLIMPLGGATPLRIGSETLRKTSGVGKLRACQVASLAIKNSNSSRQAETVTTFLASSSRAMRSSRRRTQTHTSNRCVRTEQPLIL